MKQNDEAASKPSAEGQDAGDASFPASVFEEAIQSLEAIGGLLEKVQQIASQGGASDAAMLEKLKNAASAGPEQKILEAVMQLASLLQSGVAQPNAAPAASPEAQSQSQAKPGGRFHDLV